MKIVLVKIPFLLLLLPTLLHAQTMFPKDFVFGVANAPGQVEDELNDVWLKWGQQGNIRSWKVTTDPERRLEFWTKPEAELDLARDLGVQSFRMGVDWGRIMPTSTTFDVKAIEHYRTIIKAVKARGMKVMLTLMHHSVPVWVQEQNGWHEEKTKTAFVEFSKRMIEEFNADVDWWITFNEGNVYIVNAYIVGMWPPGEKSSPLALFALGPIRGSGVVAMDYMTDAHNEIYDWAHQKFPPIKIGLAHNMAHYTAVGWLDKIAAGFADRMMNWRMPEKVRGKMDFFGFNYYGAEWIKGQGIDLGLDVEYSESGRAIDVAGLLGLLREIHQRFPKLPVIITENGIADVNDDIRGAYHVEHLQAVSQALSEGVPVQGYYVWSLTDNLEWSDGYCPKFGLSAVDRITFERKPRASFKTYQGIIKDHAISAELRSQEWAKVLALQGKDRPFCRDADGVTAFDEAKTRPYSRHDWRLPQAQRL
jgi:beta-glucosidase/6-phospho-beta-glucosidase/beta-galactosidase